MGWTESKHLEVKYLWWDDLISIPYTIKYAISL